MALFLNKLKTHLRILEHLRRRGYKVRFLVGDRVKLQKKFFNVEIYAPTRVVVKSLIDIFSILGRIIFELYRIILPYKQVENIYRRVALIASDLELELIKVYLYKSPNIGLILEHLDATLRRVLPRATYTALLLAMGDCKSLIQSDKAIRVLIGATKLVLGVVDAPPSELPKVLDEVLAIFPSRGKFEPHAARNIASLLLRVLCEEDTLTYARTLIESYFNVKLSDNLLKSLRNLICQVYPRYLKYELRVRDDIKRLMIDFLEKADKIRQEIAGILVIKLDHERKMMLAVDFMPITLRFPHSDRVTHHDLIFLLEKIDELKRKYPKYIVALVHSHPGRVTSMSGAKVIELSYPDVILSLRKGVWGIVLTRVNERIKLILYLGRLFIKEIEID